MSQLALLASGREADVYALDDRRVLRRYRDGADAAAEAAVMTHVARHDFPVPVVHAAQGPDLVLERIDGPTMAEALMTGTVELSTSAATLADLHHRLHALPALPGSPPEDRVLHLDLHPENVLLSLRGPVVIDWHNTEDGDPEVDIGMTALILAQVVVAPGDRPGKLVRALLEEFLTHVGRDLGRVLDEVVARRAADPHLTAEERHRLADAAALVAGNA